MKPLQWQFSSGLALIFLLAITIAWILSRPNEPTYLNAYLTFTSDGEVRRAILCSPPAGNEEPLPLIVAFHGVGDTPEKMLSSSHLAHLAGGGPCHVLFPAAQKGMWDIATPSTDWATDNRDVRFFRRLMEAVEAHAQFDPQRVYLVGMSNGATFAELLSIALPWEIAATVGVAGGLPEVSPESDKERRVPMLLIAGTADETGAADMIKRTAEQLQKSGHMVKVQILDDASHEWPESQNHEMWEFLSRQRLPESCQ